MLCAPNLFWIIFGGLTACAIITKYKKPVLYRITKVLPVLTVFVYGIFAHPSDHYNWILAGLFFGMAGDLFLLSAKGFIPGLISFLIGHIMYIAAFTTTGPAYSLGFQLPIVLAVLLVYYLWQLFKRMETGRRRKYQIPVTIYTVVIVLMTATGINLSLGTSPINWGLVAGVCLFPLGDGMLAWKKFVAPFPLDEFWKSVVYYGAQCFIGLSALNMW